MLGNRKTTSLTRYCQLVSNITSIKFLQEGNTTFLDSPSLQRPGKLSGPCQ